MNVYQATAEEDVLLFRWWAAMLQSGELRAFPTELDRLSVFLATMQPPTILLTEMDSQGIWFAMWAQPNSLECFIVNLWIRDTKRQSKEGLDAIAVALSHVFQQTETILAFVSDPRHVDAYVKYGLTRVGDFTVGDVTHTILSLTREAFHARALRKVG